jgi:hypothetical protein
MSAKTPVMRDDYAPFFRSRSSGGAIVWSRSRARNWSPVVNPQHCRPGRQRVRTPKAIARVILAQVVEGHRRSEGIEGVKQRRKIGVRSSSDAAPIVGVRRHAKTRTKAQPWRIAALHCLIPAPGLSRLIQSGRTSIGRMPQLEKRSRQRGVGTVTASGSAETSTLAHRPQSHVATIERTPRLRMLARSIAGASNWRGKGENRPGVHAGACASPARAPDPRAGHLNVIRPHLKSDRPSYGRPGARSDATSKSRGKGRTRSRLLCFPDEDRRI